MVFALPTTGFEDVSVTFTTRRSGSGAGTQIWSYSVDGTNYVAKDTIIVADADPVLRTLSCVGVTGVDNNPNFKLISNLTYIDQIFTNLMNKIYY